MKVLVWLFLLRLGANAAHNVDINKVRMLYQRAPEIKRDAIQLNRLMLQVDSGKDAPVLVCYKGANEMIQAKYAFSPVNKFEKFNKGKELIKKAISRDTVNLEIRFIRYTIQSNLPTFLGYHDELDTDKRFMLYNTRNCKDPELKKIIFNYLSTSSVIKPEELKQLQN
jgi:hypothetical protein